MPVRESDLCRFVSSALQMLNPDGEEVDVTVPEEIRAAVERLRLAVDQFVESRAEEDSVTCPPENLVSELVATSIEVCPRGCSAGPDRRLYLPKADGWVVRVQAGAPDRCCLRNPGEDWFHLLVEGEVHLAQGTTKLCLNCAIRQGVVTDDRRFWQSSSRIVRTSHIVFGADVLEQSDASDELSVAESNASGDVSATFLLVEERNPK